MFEFHGDGMKSFECDACYVVTVCALYGATGESEDTQSDTTRLRIIHFTVCVFDKILKIEELTKLGGKISNLYLYTYTYMYT
jgi:hypothetical protein